MNKRILVVDDEQDIVDLISYNLRKEGYSVFTATDGETALSLAAEQKPDLVILDIMMPGYDGFEICRLLRQIPATAAAS